MDVRKGKFILPNLFTLASVFLGVVAVVSCLGEPDDAGIRRAAIAILFAMVADSLDGRVARMTRTSTRFGVQLDSLADVLSFGMAPAVLGFVFGLRQWPPLLGEAIAFVYVACGALRLARFNLQADSAQPTHYFTGLPIPAAAGTVAMWTWAATDLSVPLSVRPATVAAAMIVTALLMVSTIRYPSFKHVRLSLAARAGILLLVASVVVAAVRTHTSAVLLGVALTYVVLGPAGWAIRLPSRLLARRRRAPAPERPEK